MTRLIALLFAMVLLFAATSSVFAQGDTPPTPTPTPRPHPRHADGCYSAHNGHSVRTAFYAIAGFENVLVPARARSKFFDADGNDTSHSYKLPDYNRSTRTWELPRNYTHGTGQEGYDEYVSLFNEDEEYIRHSFILLARPLGSTTPYAQYLPPTSLTSFDSLITRYDIVIYTSHYQTLSTTSLPRLSGHALSCIRVHYVDDEDR